MSESQEAASAWGGHDLRLIRNRENAVYEMRLPGGKRAALRLHRQGYQAEAAIRSELWWCAALAKAGVAVPDPLVSRSGDLLVRLDSGRIASVLAWVDGAPLGEAGRPLPGNAAQQVAWHHALGRLVAQVHRVTDGLILPGDFTRPRWDIDGLTGEEPFWGRFWEHPALTADEAATLRRARDFTRERLTDYARTAAPGPIHADVLRENVLVNGHSLSLIDFDDSGIGFRLYDLGTVMSQNLYQANRQALQAALIDGYASLRDDDFSMVDVFTLARTLASVGWAAPRLPHLDPVHRRHIDRAVMWSAQVMSGSG
ncbi:phosphotransferase enzyme family protein [Rhodobacter ferrooxidans]|uniref:Aminoglycoside phosphotransferase n=1 Tax=Rhodobacter ferrooxidans TaxID=371731 RepID=C8RWT3_9RHOB|nr:phosphotransferase [Rhodobacter sp. SW2]EEW27026.1 aminoglycoside phosphotransferase [Rhodobacter sp. SW2]